MARALAIERWSDRLTAVGFLVAIAAPLLVQLTGLRSGGAEGEQRALQARPRMEWSAAGLESYPRRFDAWYADAFGLRTELVRAHNDLEWFGLGVSPAANVLQGRDGWVFFHERRSLECSLGSNPLTSRQLDLWGETLQARSRWCRERGMTYLFVSGPTKALLYPEQLPAGWDPIGPSRLAQIHARLDELGDVEHLDLRPVLAAQKARDRPDEEDFVYYPMGTHWSARGEVAVYGALVQRLTELGALPPETVPGKFRAMRKVNGKGGDSWAGRLYLEGKLTQAVWRMPAVAKLPERVGIPFSPNSMGFRNAQGSGGLVMYHDSFAAPLRPWLGWHFARVDGFWRTHWEVARMEEAAPTVVVDFMVGRMFRLEDPATLFPDDQARLARLYEAAGPVTSLLRSPAPEDAEDIEPLAVGANDVTAFHAGDLRGWSIKRKEAHGLIDLELPASEGGADLLLEIELTAVAPATLDVLYPDRRGDYDRNSAERVRITEGRQIVYVRLAGGRLGHLPRTVRLGAARPKDWFFHRVSVRARSDS